MSIHFIIIPLLIFTGIYAAIGLYFLVSYCRIPDMRSSHVLWFIAATFLAMTYNVMRIFKYYATTCDTSYFWVRATHVIIPVLAISIAGFLNDYALAPKKWVTRYIIIGFGIIAVASLLGGNYVFDMASCSISTQTFMNVSLFHIWFWPGPIATAIYAFLILSVLYAGFHALFWGINGDSKETKPIFISGLIMTVVIISDVFTSYRMISYVFLGEFVFFFFLLAMCYSTINQMSSQLTQKQVHPVARDPNATMEELLKGLNIEDIKKDLLSLMNDEKAYMDETVSLESIANRLGLHPARFSRFMNLAMNSDFRNFINTFRVEEAKRLLAAEPDLSIKYICYEVGFQSKSTFNDVFKKFTGTTPSAFRKTSSP